MPEESNQGKEPAGQPGDTSADLSARTARYKEEVEKVVREVGEHPLYELKRACVLQDLAEKIELVKDVQSIATSRIDNAKFLVIGADDANKSFCSVQNLSDFDEASIRQLLDKYLDPVPEFELFKLGSSEGHAFVLLVIPKQRTRRILAKVTVEDNKNGKPRTLLRKGDLWTRGSSTGKRLATPEDWDEIYEERIEIEAEQRARRRTEHLLEMAAARERMRPTSRFSLPSYFTDAEFQPLMEELCGAQDGGRFNVLLERLRDDLVEGWHEVGAYRRLPEVSAESHATISDLREKLRDHIKNVFRPAMHWLTVAGLGVVKNAGPPEFLDRVVDLLREVFETSRLLQLPHALTAYGTASPSADEHVSHTVPALESLVSLHLIGAYLTKRRRFSYFRNLLRAQVYKAGYGLDEEKRKTLMALWPLEKTCGEPEELQYRAGRISHCVRRVKTDAAYLRLFGSETMTTRALCEYELCLELNSYLAMSSERESASQIAKKYPGMYFAFWPSLIAFSLENICDLASTLFAEIRTRTPELLKLIVFDPDLVRSLIAPGGDMKFARFIDGLAGDHAMWCVETRRFPGMVSWPKELGDAMKQARTSQ